jgi:antirestriction protein ArdC
MIKALLPKCNIKVKFVDLLNGDWGRYDPATDLVLIDRTKRKEMPHSSLLVLIHELMHSTMMSRRTLRINRLIHKFGEYKKNSASYRVEECIAELSSLIIARKLGILTASSMVLYTEGLKQHYTNDLFIPWREVVAAVRYYAEDDTDFTREFNFVRNYARFKYNIDIRDSYDTDVNPVKPIALVAH